MSHGTLAICSTPVILGAIGGAALGVVLTLGHPDYPDQVVISLATVGANLGSCRSRAVTPISGDGIVLTVLVLLTAIVAGWHLAEIPGAIAGAGLGACIAFARFRPR